jgi:membrane peptidoglycan carboxypeptidase
MDKTVSLLWILFAVGAFVYRMVKKMQETSIQESQERPRRPGGAVPELPTATFQEMLRQMQSRNAAEPSPAPDPSPTAASPGERTLGGRPMPHETARPTRSQERTLVRQTSLEAPATAQPRTVPTPLARRSSSLPRASARAPIPSAPPAARPASTLNETVRQMLHQPESVRAAFVFSEIFQRKY